MVAQTIQFETVSVSEVGSGTVTAFLFSGTTLTATLGGIAENGTLEGRNTGVVNDVAAGQYRLVVKFNGYTVSEPDLVVDLLLAVGTYVSYRAAALDPAAILAVADQVWDEATSGHTTAGTYGGRIVRAINSNVEVAITGSNHIAADVHEFQTGVITAGDFAANSITASALATDAVTEIQSGLATAAALATESGKITNIENASGYLLAVLAGACADPQTASETYAITVFGSTFTVDMAGQTSTGTRTAPTLTKT